MFDKLLKSLLEQERELLNLLSEQEQAISATKSKLQLVTQFKDLYNAEIKKEKSAPQTSTNSKKPVLQMAVEILKRENRFLKTYEIKEFLEAQGRHVEYLSSFFTISVSKGRIVKVKLDNDNNKVYMGLPEWVDSKGQPKKGYEIKE